MKIFKNQSGFGLVEGLLVVIALTLVAFVGYYVYDKQSSKSEEPQVSEVTTEEEAEAPPTEEAPPELVEYGPDGIEIAKKADVDQLSDASDSFKSYMASQVGENEPSSEDCDAYIFQVFKIVNDEFASGGSGSPCGGGGGVVWKKEAGTWDSVLGYQDIPQCKVVDKYEIPASILKKCLIEDSSDPSGFSEVVNSN